MNKIHNDEIDLLEFFQTIWNGKILISAFILMAILSGTGYIYFKEALYETRITYFLDNKPPFYKKDEIFSDFKKIFYSKSVFSDWKNIDGKTSIVFEDFSYTSVVDGFVVTTTDDTRLASIVLKDRYIRIMTNELAVSEDFFKYIDFVNNILNKKYLDRAQEEINIIKARFKNRSQGANSKMLFDYILANSRFVSNANLGVKVLSVQHPKLPKKISPNSKLILFICFIFGVIIGVCFVFISNFIRKNKKLAD